jgi:LCP family protein required for cell wall assembly
MSHAPRRAGSGSRGRLSRGEVACSLLGAAVAFSLEERRRRGGTSGAGGQALLPASLRPVAEVSGRPERHRRQRPSLRRVSALLVAASIAFWGITVGIQQVAESQTGSPSPLTSTTLIRGHAVYPTQNPNLISVALLGSDNPGGPPNAPSACDALHIITINTATMKGSILNVTYDYYIDGQKITDICRQKGYVAAMADLRAYSGLPIQYYAATDFTDFEQVMDEIGGLDIHVFQRLDSPADTGANFVPGDTAMLGGDLLAFARERLTAPGGDFGRSTDQAQIVLSGLNKFRGRAGPDFSYIFTIIRDGRQHVEFNVPLTQLIQWGLIARSISPTNIQSCTLVANGQVIGGSDVDIPDPSNQPIFAQVAKDGTIPANAQCFQYPASGASGINWNIPPSE